MTDAQKIFISYRRHDSSYPTGWLYERLAARFGRRNVYKDVDNLKPGDDFVESITRAIATCHVLIAVIGPRWGSTDEHGRRRIDDPGDYVRREIEAALDQHILVIPVLVDEAVMPDGNRLPPGLQPLARRHAIRLTPAQFRRDTKDLVAFIRQELSADTWWGRLLSRLDAVVYALQGAWRHKVLILALVVVLVVGGGIGLAVRLAHRSTTAVALPQSAAALPDDVLLWRRQTGPPDDSASYTIDLVTTSGAKVRTLIPDQRNRSAVLTPDRRTVLYIRDTNDDPEVDELQLRAIAADGQGDRLLFNGRDVDCPILKRPAVRGDGQLAVVCRQSKTGVSTLSLRELDGSVIKVLDERHYLDDPTFTRDGESVIYWRAQNASKDVGGSLYQVGTGGTPKPAPLTSGADGVDAFPVMAPNDDRLAFTRRISDTEENVMILGSLDPGARVVTQTHGANDAGVSWSPDGRWLAFLRQTDHGARLLMVDAQSSAVVTVATNDEDYYTGAPVWTAR